MGILLEALRRARTTIKLRRGRCHWCNAVMRDDAAGPYCSDACADARAEANLT